MKLIGRVCGAESAGSVDTCLTVDKSSNHVILNEPSAPQLTTCSQRQLNTAPRLFMFDKVFGPDDSLVGLTPVNYYLPLIRMDD